MSVVDLLTLAEDHPDGVDEWSPSLYAYIDACYPHREPSGRGTDGFLVALMDATLTVGVRNSDVACIREVTEASAALMGIGEGIEATLERIAASRDFSALSVRHIHIFAVELVSRITQVRDGAVPPAWLVAHWVTQGTQFD